MANKEIEIQIEWLEADMQKLTNKVYSFSEYGRYPDENDWLEIITLLNEWNIKRHQLIVLKECLEASNNNLKYA